MRFSTSAVLSLSMVALALALPFNAPVSERNLIAREIFEVSDEVATVKVNLSDLVVRDVQAVEDIQDIQPVLEARQSPEEVVEIINGIIEIATKVDNIVQGIINADIKRRQQFTQQTVAGLRQRFPSTNFVMSNVGYSFTGKEITKKQVFYHNHIGAKVSYDVIAFKHGTFQLQGDGGFQNWAAIYDSTCKHHDKFIQC